MQARVVALVALAAAVTLTSVAAAGPAETSLPPSVGRIARELAGGGAQRVIVFASVGDESYVATAGTRRPSANQRFRVGSVTKTFTATIVLQLLDEGKLGLSNPLEDHLPGVVPRGNEITIRQLLQHRSGLVNYTDYTSWLKGPSRSGSVRPIDLVRFAGSKPLAFEPGKQWSYSNTNYIALGLIIEQVTGDSYAHELDQRIFRPLGLDDTELPQTRLLPGLGDNGELLPGLHKDDPTAYDVDWANPSVSWAAGGIVSNGRDISRFYSALLSGQILSGASLAKMKETVGVGPGAGAGLGIFSGSSRCGRSWGHGGGILDYITSVSASEKGDRVGVTSVYGALSDISPDESALVCPEYRLAAPAADSKIAFTRAPHELSVTNADGTERRQLTGNASLATPAWSPDGKKIAFVRERGGNSEVYVMNADGGRQQRLAPGNAPAWSPDGKKIAFVRSGDIYVMNADGSEQRNLTRNAASDSDAAWSHDGKKIAFVRERGGNSEVVVMDADGTGQRTLTRTAARDEDPVWSPDGRIAFARKVPGRAGGVGGQFEIFVTNADGSGQRRLTRNLSGDLHPAWSPDGRKIVFESRGTSGGGGSSWAWYDVYVVNPDGSGQPTRLTTETKPRRNRAPRAALPAWSPDGRMIAFLRSSEGNDDVYVMNADGSGQTNVTRSKAYESRFAWSPGRRKGHDPYGRRKGMNARHAVLVALAAAVTLTSVAAAGPAAAKQRVAIDMKICPQGTFVLTPLQTGSLKGDSGTIDSNWTSIPGRKVMRDGQEVTIYNGAVTTLTGKRGTLTIRDRNEWVDLARDGNGDGEDDGIGIGTWKVTRGTGQYAGIVGKGRNAHVGLGCPWYARYEGLLTAP